MKDKQKRQIFPMKTTTQKESAYPPGTGTSPADSENPDGRESPGKGVEAGKNTAIGIGYLRFLLRLTLIALLGLVIFTKVFLITQATGNEMFPSIKDGDLVFAFRAQRDYAKNDVVVYAFEQKKTIGRIAALEGDVVALDENGILLVNGTAQSGEILYPTYPKEKLTYPYKVPTGSVFLLGDYRSIARDSRERGAISLEDVEGKVITILRRRGL